MIHFVCPHCYHEISISDQAAGRFIDCKGCQKRIEVPTKEEAEMDLLQGRHERKPQRKSKVGLILAACFFGLTVLGLVIVLIAKKDQLPANVFDGSASIRDHKFFERKLTEQEVKNLIGTIERHGRGSIIWIDSRGETRVVDGQTADLYRDGSFPPGYNTGLKAPLFGFDMARYQVQPTREQIIKDLIEMLDRAAFATK